MDRAVSLPKKPTWDQFLAAARGGTGKNGAKKSVASFKEYYPLALELCAPQGLERHAGLRLFATLVQNRFWLGVWLMLAMKIALSDDRGLLEQAAGRDVEGEPDELGVCPFQRSGR